MVVAGNSYTHDYVGNRLTNTTEARTLSYLYDAIYRLTNAEASTPGWSGVESAAKGKGGKGSSGGGNGGGISNATGNQAEYYTYDPIGNRLTSHNNRSYSYNVGNQLTDENGATYTYDRNGNLMQKTSGDETATYYYDYENRLVRVERVESGEAVVVDYKYDPFGRRIEKKVTPSPLVGEGGGEGSTTTRYLYDNEDILFEYDTSGIAGNRYVHGPGIDAPLAVEQKNKMYYYHADGLGSIVALTDSAGGVVQDYQYDSFGNLKDQKNRIKQPYTYTAREWDTKAKLYYYRARYYNAEVGRFLSKDPIGFMGGINPYNYVAGNPINWVDPFGLKPGDKYPTQDKAATAALDDIINISISQDLEYAGWIYKFNGGCEYSYTNPRKGAAHSSHPGAKPSNATAVYHTHGAESGPKWADENFSKSDMNFARKHKVDIYLRTPSGKQLKFSP